jgi:uncharacterized protein (DUF2252 family)
MSEPVKATIIGTIIVGIFMLLCTKMATRTVWDLARSTKSYVEMQKAEAKRVVKAEKSKATDVFLEGAHVVSGKIR